MTLPQPPADPAAPPTDTGAGGTGGQPDTTDYKSLYEAAQAQVQKLSSDSTTWMNRFTGLQGTYQREQSKWKEDAGKIAGMSEQLASLQATMEVLTGEKSTLAEQLDTVRVEAEIAKARTDRMEILIKEFPVLLPYEADGLLPDGSGDEFRNKCKLFAEKLGSQAADAFKKLYAGATPPQPGSDTDPKTPEALQKEALSLFSQGKMEEYDLVMNQYYEALGKAPK